MNENDPTRSLGFLIYEVSRLIRRNFDKRVQPLGFTQAQWRTIAHIAHFEGCNQCTLAEVLEVKPITLSRILDKLQHAGWIERRQDTLDKRAFRLYLSKEGYKIMEKMQQYVMQTRAQAYAGLDRKEQKLLFQLLQKIKENLAS
jgi:MarR family transcriptional regulator, transcriptional regulator for hemolysin